MIPIVIMFSAMLIFYIAMKHEHREEEKTDAYMFRHQYDEDKLEATAVVAAAYKELVDSDIIK